MKESKNAIMDDVHKAHKKQLSDEKQLRDDNLDRKFYQNRQKMRDNSLPAMHRERFI